MIHPSYYELIDKINADNASEDAPVITSRYSIVLATSKRARQLTDGAEPKVPMKENEKLLSVAIKELYEGAVNILTEEQVKAEEEAEAAAKAAEEAEAAEEAAAEEAAEEEIEEETQEAE